MKIGVTIENDLEIHGASHYILSSLIACKEVKELYLIPITLFADTFVFSLYLWLIHRDWGNTICAPTFSVFFTLRCFCETILSVACSGNFAMKELITTGAIYFDIG